MSLMDIQSWYIGELYGIEEITNQEAHFDPLFIYQKNGMVDVYYCAKDVDLAVEIITKHFNDNSNKFSKLATRYIRHCDDLDKLSRNKNIEDFSQIYDLICEIWPAMSVIIVLGEFIEEERLKDIAQQALDLRTEKGEVIYHASETLLELAGQKHPQMSDFTGLMTFEEIELEKKLAPSELADRENGFFYFGANLYTNCSTARLEKEQNIQLERHTTEQVDVVKGQVASIGKVKGRVRVMLKAKSLERFQDGEVLVSAMTTPDFMPIMKKAVAFVTDEGGVTCHAAIVSRELGVPCIVGTGVATRVLRTGEFVEVDAERGIVRKL